MELEYVEWKLAEKREYNNKSIDNEIDVIELLTACCNVTNKKQQQKQELSFTFKSNWGRERRKMRIDWQSRLNFVVAVHLMIYLPNPLIHLAFISLDRSNCCCHCCCFFFRSIISLNHKSNIHNYMYGYFVRSFNFAHLVLDFFALTFLILFQALTYDTLVQSHTHALKYIITYTPKG